MSSVRFAIEGMTCQGCVKAVTAVLRQLDGVEVQRVSVGSAEVSLDASKTSPMALAAALADAGFPAQPVEQPAK